MSRTAATAAPRRLLVIADDFGIGPATSQGILDLAREGLVTGTVLLVTSPYAAAAVEAWQQCGKPVELGWHPCLTLDRPLSPAGTVASLVNGQGRFHSLRAFLLRLFSRRIDPEHLRRELATQYDRFLELTGVAPLLVNAHHHLHLFRPIYAVLQQLFVSRGIRPYVRRVQEQPRWLLTGNSRLKRMLLSGIGSRAGRSFDREHYAGNTWLTGQIEAWSAHGGTVVEIMCHPGFYDTTLLYRDSPGGQRGLQRRVEELQALKDPTFRQGWMAAGYELTTPSAVRIGHERSIADAT